MQIRYEDHQNTIKGLAWKWSSPTVNFHDLVSEGNEVFVVAVSKFNHNNGTKFNTYLYKALNNAMCDFAVKGICYGEKKRPVIKAEDVEIKKISTHKSISPERYAILKDWMENLSQEAQYILTLIWETPVEIVEMAREETHCPKNSMKYLRRYLRDRDWSWLAIDHCFKEIKTALKNII